MTLIDDIAAHLITGGLASSIGVDIFLQRYPSAPLDSITVSSLPGEKSRYFTDENDEEIIIDNLACGVTVRNTDPQAAYDQIKAIADYLDHNPPSGYYQCHVMGERDQNTTASDDLTDTDGAVYQFTSHFKFILRRA